MKAPGFVNLRGTATASTNEDSVWPSFTDVMMVIVMVFLMALVVILIRNVDLTDQLDKTERRVERDSAEKTAFEMNIAGLGDEVVGLRLQLGEVTRRAELAQAATADRDQQIGGLVQSVASLEQARDRLARDNVTLVGREGALQAELLSLEQTQQALLAVRGELETEVTRLDKEKSGVEKERRVLSQTLTTVTRERDDLSKDKAQLVKTQDVLRKEKESMVARLVEQGTLLASRQKQLVTLSGAHQVLGEEKVAATEALRSRTSERDILSLEKSRLLEEGTTTALRLEVLAEEKRELETEVTRLDKEKSGVEKERRVLSQTLTTVTRERDDLSKDKAQLVKKQGALRIEKESMVAQLTKTRQQNEGVEAEIVRLRRQVEELGEKEQALVGEREAAQKAIERLEKKRSRLLQQAEALRAVNAQLARDYLEAQRIQRQMREDIASYSKKLGAAEGAQQMSVQALAARKARYAKEIAALQRKQRALVDELKGQYSALQVKYDRLVRPARTFLGKHVVRIGYWKEGGIFRYSLREPGETQARNVNEQQLHSVLTALKSDYGKRLYTKILFPREAELSQKDAWQFTHQILRQYDYYSR